MKWHWDIAADKLVDDAVAHEHAFSYSMPIDEYLCWCGAKATPDECRNIWLASGLYWPQFFARAYYGGYRA